MGDDYIKGETLLPWAPFRSPLTDHDKAVIAELTATGAARIAAAKAESLAKLADYNKIKRAQKSWGKAPRDGARWNATKNKWE